MDLDSIEVLLARKLRRLMRKQVDIIVGPTSTLALGGMQETIFVHASRFDDHHGVTPDGATIARRPIQNGRVSGTVEERPCSITVEVVCVATTYSRIKVLSGRITPEILLILACEREFEVGASASRQSSLVFTDFQASINQVETLRQEDDDIVFHIERLVFHMNGALHVRLSKYGGLKAKSSLTNKTVGKGVRKAVRKSSKNRK